MCNLQRLASLFGIYVYLRLIYKKNILQIIRFFEKIDFCWIFWDLFRFSDFLTFLDIFLFLGFFMDFLGGFFVIFFGIFSYFLNFFGFLRVLNFFKNVFRDFFDFFSKVQRLLLKVIEVTTEHQKWPKVSQNSILKKFAQRAKKNLARGQIPPQDLEVKPA